MGPLLEEKLVLNGIQRENSNFKINHDTSQSSQNKFIFSW